MCVCSTCILVVIVDGCQMYFHKLKSPFITKFNVTGNQYMEITKHTALKSTQ